MNKELLEALLKVQKEIPFVKRTTEAYNYKYAPLEHVWEKTKDPIQNNGFFVSHEVQETGVLTTASHEHGELKSFIPFSKSELKPQDMGSEITYFKRYNLIAIFNIQVEGEDDDATVANKAAGGKTQVKKPAQTSAQSATGGTKQQQTTSKEPVSEKQLGLIWGLGCKELGYANTKVTAIATKLYRVKTLPELNKTQASNYIELLQKKIKQENSKQETIDVGDEEHTVEAKIPTGKEDVNPDEVKIDEDPTRTFDGKLPLEDIKKESDETKKKITEESLICSNKDCGKTVTKGIANSSEKKYGRILCMGCQLKEGAVE